VQKEKKGIEKKTTNGGSRTRPEQERIRKWVEKIEKVGGGQKKLQVGE